MSLPIDDQIAYIYLSDELNFEKDVVKFLKDAENNTLYMYMQEKRYLDYYFAEKSTEVLLYKSFVDLSPEQKMSFIYADGLSDFRDDALDYIAKGGGNTLSNYLVEHKLTKESEGDEGDGNSAEGYFGRMHAFFEPAISNVFIVGMLKFLLFPYFMAIILKFISHRYFLLKSPYCKIDLSPHSNNVYADIDSKKSGAFNKNVLNFSSGIAASLVAAFIWSFIA
jgi:hypothetical protein